MNCLIYNKPGIVIIIKMFNIFWIIIVDRNLWSCYYNGQLSWELVIINCNKWYLELYSLCSSAVMLEIVITKDLPNIRVGIIFDI